MNIVEISPRDGFNLFLRYDDGVAGVVDLCSLTGRGVFASWLEPGLFEQVQLTEAGAPEWPGEVGLCPDALHLELSGKASEEIFPTLRRMPTHA